MKLKKKDILLSVVSLVLIGAAIVGMVALYRNVDESFSKNYSDSTTDTGPSDESSSGGNTSTDTTPVQGRYIDPDGYGYQVIDNVTVFFKKVSLSEYHKQEISAGNGSYVRAVVNAQAPAYGTFVVTPKVSLDGIFWSDFGQTLCAEGTSSEIQAYYTNYSLDVQEVYISYTFVTDCAAPLKVLEDLRDNMMSLYFAAGGENSNIDIYSNQYWIPRLTLEGNVAAG